MNRTANDITIVCYDFTNNKLRRKVEKTLLNYGVRVQFSMYACRLKAEHLNELRCDILNLLDKFCNNLETTDNIVILEHLPFNKIDTIFGTKWPSNERCKVY